MSLKIFNKEKFNLYHLLSTGSVVFALLFLVVVGVVVYRGISEAFTQSEKASANVSTLDIKDEDLLEAVGLAEQWKQQQKQQLAPTVSEVKKSDLVIEVLNGTTEINLASTIADRLRLSGFTNSHQATSSPEAELKVTQLRRKLSVKLYEELVIEVLSLTTEAINIVDLSEDSKSDMVVIIGQDLSDL